LADRAALEVEEVEAVKANNELDVSVQQMIVENTLTILEGLSDKDEVDDGQSEAGVLGRSEMPLGSEACDSELISAEVGEVVTKCEESNKMDNEKKVVELLEKNAVLNNQYDASVAELAEANKDKEELQAKNEELEAKLEETLALVKEKEDSLAAKAEAFEKLEAEKIELDTKLEETSTELAEIEEARKLDSRKAVLAGLGLSEDRIVRILAKTNELDTEAFDAEVDDLKAFMSELTPVAPILEETPETDTVETVETEEVVAEEVEEVEASDEELAEVLEEVEEEGAPVAEAVGTVCVEETEETEQIQSAMAKALGVNL
jgi:predicted nuclease with TOPRIM domain